MASSNKLNRRAPELALSFNFCHFVAAPKPPPLSLYPYCTQDDDENANDGDLIIHSNRMNIKLVGYEVIICYDRIT